MGNTPRWLTSQNQLLQSELARAMTARAFLGALNAVDGEPPPLGHWPTVIQTDAGQPQPALLRDVKRACRRVRPTSSMTVKRDPAPYVRSPVKAVRRVLLRYRTQLAVRLNGHS